MPVRLPPGRFRLATRPNWTGSDPIRKTIGIVGVAAFAASAARVALPVVITLTRRRTSSAASAGNRSYLILGPAVLDRHVLAFDIASLIEAKTERLHNVREQVRRCCIEKADH